MRDERPVRKTRWLSRMCEEIAPCLPVAVSVFHFIGASGMALGALRPQPRHGFGSQYLLALRGNDNRVTQADQLARQEIRNSIR